MKQKEKNFNKKQEKQNNKTGNKEQGHAIETFLQLQPTPIQLAKGCKM